tara:strand:+ start:488 stop:664 length:177 start_codon:yes stop_codon:yes gene_type:complete
MTISPRGILQRLLGVFEVSDITPLFPLENRGLYCIRMVENIFSTGTFPIENEQNHSFT